MKYYEDLPGIDPDTLFNDNAMKISITIILLLTIQISNAQVILIQPHLGNCVRCNLYLQLFDTKYTDIPTYLVFGSDNLSDRDEIESRLQYRDLGLKVIYSDRLLNYFDDAATIVYLDRDGKAKIRSSFDKLTKDLVTEMKQQYSTDHKFACSPTKTYKLTANELIIHDVQVNNLKEISNFNSTRDTFLYKMTPELEKTIREKFRLVDPLLSKTTDEYFSEKPRMKNIFKSSFDSYATHNGNIYTIASIPFIRVLSGDSLEMLKQYSIVKFNGGRLEDVYLINLPDNDGNNDTLLFPSYFYIKDDSSFLFVHFTASSLKEKHTPYIGEYHLKDGSVTFKKQLNIDLPEFYKNKALPYPDPFTYTPLFRVDYPYFSTAIYPEIVDLKNEKKYVYQLPAAINWDTVNMDINKSYFQNWLLFKDLPNSNIYLTSVIDQQNSLQIISSDNFKLKKIVKLSDIKIKEDYPLRHFQVLPEQKIVYVSDDEHLVRGYPLDLFLGDY